MASRPSPVSPDAAVDIVDVITAQHRMVDDLLTQAEQAEPEQAQELLRQVEALLTPHSNAEESFVYPTIAAAAKDEAEQVADSQAEHHHVEGLLQQLLAAQPDAPGFDGLLAAFIGEIRHHVEEEETDLLPVLKSKLGEDERAQLGARFVTETGMDPELLDAVDLRAGEATKDELYEQARELDIAGRSGMSKDELASAVSRAGSPTSR